MQSNPEYNTMGKTGPRMHATSSLESLDKHNPLASGRGGETDADADADGTMRLKPDRMRVIDSDMVPREIRTSHTVASVLLGEHSSLEHFLYNLGVRNQVSTGGLWVMWGVGVLIGMLVVGEALPVKFVWGSLLMLPLPVVAFSLMSVDLVMEIMQSLDLYVILILQIAVFVDGIYYCRGDLRRIFWYCYLPTMITSGFTDAYPAKYRPLFAKLFYGGAVVILIVWNCFLIFKWQVLGVGIHKLKNITFALHHIADQVTLIVFCCRHIYASLMRPDYFIMIKADVLTMRRSTASFFVGGKSKNKAVEV